MRDYQIITDAACDMNGDILKQHNIDVIPMEVAMDDGTVFRHYPDFREFPAQDFYGELARGNLAHTSQITPVQFAAFFTPYLQAGLDVLYTGLSSGLSATFDNACIAAGQLAEEFPARRVVVVDSLCACGGEGMMAVRAAENRAAGMSLEENAAWIEANRLKLAHYFTVGDLFYLHKGGRVSAAKAVVGSALHIKPMMYVDDEGKLQVPRSVRGRKNSYHKLIEYTRRSILNPEEQTLYISCTDLYEDALQLREQVLKEIPCKDAVITRIGPVIATHTGPQHMCLFSFGSGRLPQE